MSKDIRQCWHFLIKKHTFFNMKNDVLSIKYFFNEMHRFQGKSPPFKRFFVIYDNYFYSFGIFL